MIIINHFYYLYVYGFMGTPAVWRFIGHTFGVRVQKVQKVQRVQRVQRGRLTALRAEGCGRLSAAGCVPTGGTTHYDLCVASAPSNHVRCASLRSGGNGPSGRGLWIALTGNEFYKPPAAVTSA